MKLSPISGNRLIELESVRGIAALLVVIHHIPHWNSGFFDVPVLRNGYLMVELFFVLSGFVIYRAYSENIRNPRELFQFQFLRFGRLYPIHLLFLLLFLGFEIVKYIAAKYYGIGSPNSVPFDVNNAQAFMAHLFLAEGTGILPRVGSFNSPSWSISVEFYTYLIFGFIILKARRFKIAVFTVLLIVSYILCIIPEFNRFDYMLICLIGFSCGCLVAAAVNLKTRQLPAGAPLLPLILLAVFLSYYPVGQGYPLIYVISAGLIYTLVKSKDGWIKNMLKTKLLVRLGELSYSIYMSHFLVIWIANQFIRIILKRPNVRIGNEFFPQLSLLENFIAVTVIVAVTIAISWITFTFIEKPFRQRSRNLVSSWQTAG